MIELGFTFTEPLREAKKPMPAINKMATIKNKKMPKTVANEYFKKLPMSMIWLNINDVEMWRYCDVAMWRCFDVVKE
jgi:hypothetical protein